MKTEKNIKRSKWNMTDKELQNYIKRYNHFVEWGNIHPEICWPHIIAIEKHAKENNIELHTNFLEKKMNKMPEEQIKALQKMQEKATRQAMKWANKNTLFPHGK